MTAVIEGPYLAVCGLLAAAGAAKLARPDTTAKALVAAGFRVRAWQVRAAALAELVIGLGAAATGSAVLALAVAVSYAAFGVFVVAALARGWPLSTCGCFGTVDTPPTAGHVVVDVGAAAVAGGVAVAAGTPLAAALRGQTLGGVPFLVAVASVGILLFEALTAGARLGAIRARARASARQPATAAGRDASR
ncbi:MAG: MauE/DoxX family redox-associated membrane protein [Acidimicrobiales bacterium]